MPTRLDPRMFKADLPLVMARFATLYAHDIHPGEPLAIVDGPITEDSAKGEVTLDVAVRLWLSTQAVYEKDWNPTPIETPEQEAERVVEMEASGGGWYLIRAPWLGEGEKVKGKAAAQTRYDEIVAKGDTKGVTVTGGDGGWYEVKAPWLDDAEKVQGADAANARADELIAAGPPAGWRLLTDEEKALAREQAEALDAARAEADRVAAEGAAADKAVIDAAYLARAKALGFTEEEWATVDTASRDQVLNDREVANSTAASAAAAAAAAGDTTVTNVDPAAGDAAAEAGQTFTATPTAGGWHEITGPGLDAPVKVQGAEAAAAKVEELTVAHTEANPATPLEPAAPADASAAPGEASHPDGAVDEGTAG